MKARSSKSKTRTKKGFKRWIKVVSFTTFLGAINFRLASALSYKVSHDIRDADEPLLLCKSGIYLYKVILKNDPPIAFSLKNFENAEELIKATPTSPNGLYKRYEAHYPTPTEIASGASRTCYYADPAETNLKKLVVILETGKSVSGGVCQIWRIITTSRLKECPPGLAFEPLDTALLFKVAEDVIYNFKTIDYDTGFLADDSAPYSILLEVNGWGNVLEEELYNMMLMDPIIQSRSYNSDVALFSHTLIGKLNNDVQNTAFVKTVNPQSYIPRLVRGALPGYFLGKIPGSEIVGGEVLQYVEKWADGKGPKSLLINTYIENTELLLPGQKHSLVVESHGFKTPDRGTSSLESFFLKFEFSRLEAENQIQVVAYKNGVVWKEFTFSQFTKTKFLYLGFLVGRGVLEFEEHPKVLTRLLLTVFFYQENQKQINFYDETAAESVNRDTIYEVSGQQTTDRWTSIRYQAPDGSDLNKIGIRVTQVAYAKGTYPGSHIVDATPATPIGCEESCLLVSFRKDYCHMKIFGVSKDKPASLCATRENNEKLNLLSNKPEMEHCQLGLTLERCIIPKVGYWANLEISQRQPLGKNYPVSQSKFDVLRQEYKNFYTIYQDEVSGRNYLVGCPYECMCIFNPFSNFFR